MAWYYKPVNGKVQGSTCWYCGRTWYTVYRPRREYDTMSKFRVVLGTDADLRSEFLVKVSW